MTLLDYISFMEDKANIDKYVFIKKEKTITTQEEYNEETTLEDGTVQTEVKTRPIDSTTVEIYKCTFLEGGGIKKELYIQEMIDALITAKQDEIARLEEDKQIVTIL